LKQIAVLAEIVKKAREISIVPRAEYFCKTTR
jgi:hypothetical protein